MLKQNQSKCAVPNCWSITDPKIPGFTLKVNTAEPASLSSFQAFTPDMAPGGQIHRMR